MLPAVVADLVLRLGRRLPTWMLATGFLVSGLLALVPLELATVVDLPAQPAVNPSLALEVVLTFLPLALSLPRLLFPIFWALRRTDAGVSGRQYVDLGARLVLLVAVPVVAALVAAPLILRATPAGLVVGLLGTGVVPLLYAGGHPRVFSAIFGGRSLGNTPFGRAAFDLAARAHVSVGDVVLIRRLRGANAWLSGLGPARRIIFVTEVLTERLSEDELRAVIAQELGLIRYHQLLYQVLVGVGAMALFTVAGVLLDPIAPLTAESVVLRGAATGLVWDIAASAVCRRCAFAADRFAALLVGDPGPVISAPSKVGGPHISLGPVAALQGRPPLPHRIRRLRAMAP